MLTLTNDAASAIRTLVTEGDLPAESALRISSRAPDNGAPAFALTIEVNPHPLDQVVETEGARVYVDPDIVAALDGKELDAQVTVQGDVRFVLGEQDDGSD